MVGAGFNSGMRQWKFARHGWGVCSCFGRVSALWHPGILNAESRTGDELHDEWRWQRSDMALAFDQMSGRPIERFKA